MAEDKLTLTHDREQIILKVALSEEQKEEIRQEIAKAFENFKLELCSYCPCRE